MKTKHTPGEWIAKGSEHNRKTWIECNSKRICDVKESEEDWYNAKLIAAAPDLLEALLKVVADPSILDGAIAYQLKTKYPMTEGMNEKANKYEEIIIAIKKATE